MIAPDQTTFDYLQGRPHAPTGRRLGRRGGGVVAAAQRRRRRVRRRGRTSTPPSSRRSSPGAPTPARACRCRRACPTPSRTPTSPSAPRPSGRWRTWAWRPGTPLRDIAVDTVFVGSCTNGRIEDLRAAAEVLKGRRVADGVRMLVVPGSARVRLQAEAEGLDKVFTEAGAEWRLAGCSMCLGMNPDQLAPGERSASTSNRNFEGRQGKGGRTHLVCPLVAAATARARHPVLPRRPLRPEGNHAMDAFTTHTGVGVPLRRSNVDTDQIIPAVYLKRVTRTGFEDGLFAAWRGDETFVLNHPHVRRRARSWSPGPTSAPGPPASTPSGR